MRTIIALHDDQVRALNEYCLKEKVSRAEAIRRAVDKLVEDAEDAHSRRQAIFDEAFGMWKDRGIDTDTYLAEIRSEWDR